MSPLLQPLGVLLGWSCLIFLWMYRVRFPAMRAAGIDLRGRRGGKGTDLDGVVDPKAQWKAHNYNHLMEQPTLYYACILALAMIGDAWIVTLCLAWAYVGLRVLHSLEQTLVNRIRVRFPLFFAASLCLFGLVVRLLFLLFTGE